MARRTLTSTLYRVTLIALVATLALWCPSYWDGCALGRRGRA